MATVFDVAKYILEQSGEMTTIKLQKLVYYSQAWSLVWDETPLFDEPIEAWKMGPVVKKLYSAHKGLYNISAQKLNRGDSNALKDFQRETINAVLKAYGKKPAQWLIDLSHSEEPWKKAREGLPDEYGCDAEIKTVDIAEYYSSL